MRTERKTDALPPQPPAPVLICPDCDAPVRAIVAWHQQADGALHCVAK
jgi:hypothetical protein